MHKFIVNQAICPRLPVGRLMGGLAFCFVAAAVAQDSVLVTTNYFNVSGESARELRRSINQSRPWKDRSEGDANTEWKIEWTFKLMPSGTTCQVHSFTTKTTIKIVLPKWTPDASASPILTERWESYMTALKRHEEGHKQIALAAASEVRRRVKSLKPEATCEAYSASLNSAAKGVIAEFREKEIEYDRKTDHGATQGARFP